MKLPDSFTRQMEDLLGPDELQAFLKSYEKKRLYGLRVNRTKLSPERFKEIAPFPVTPIPWIDNGFFYEGDIRPARDPFYFAGMYYLQEPSAMTPANRLPVTPGERVLDLCAAPGGKSTELAAKLAGKGTLFCNDISPSRLKALLKNLELFGVENACILSETPQRLAERFPAYFDKILIDAPCSGEGMFRKEPAVIGSWLEHGNDYYVNIQKEITRAAIGMLKPGGMLLYSTCTFCPKENEQIIEYMTGLDPSLSVIPVTPYEGFSPGHPEWAGGDESLRNCVRIWPHKMDGEGHFLTLLKKAGESSQWEDREAKGGISSLPDSRTGISVPVSQAFTGAFSPALEFFSQVKRSFPYSRLCLRQEKLMLLPEGADRLDGLRVMRSGLLLGEIKKGRFEPSQALAMTLGPESFANCLDLSREDPRVLKYLKGETIEASSCADGYVLICTEGFALGFGKAKNGSIKNRLLAGWRYM